MKFICESQVIILAYTCIKEIKTEKSYVPYMKSSL